MASASQGGFNMPAQGFNQGPQQGRTVANTLTGETQFHPYTDGRMRDIEGSLRGSGQNMVTPSRAVPDSMLRGPMPIGSIGSAESSGQQPNNGMMMDLRQESPTNGQMIPRGGPQQATPNPNAQGFDSFRSNAGLPPPMPEMDRMAGSLRSDYNYRPPSDYRDRGLGRQPTVSQPMAQGGYNVNTASAQGLQQAQQGAAAEMGYRPMAVNSGGYRPSQTSATGYTSAGVGSQGYDAAQSGQAPTLSADQVAGGQIAGTDLQNYMNPYENQVVQQSLNDLERSRLMAQNVGGAQAGAANAFGGSRQGIAEAETNRAFADQAARTASGLRQAGYDRSTQLAGQDIATRMQAGLANQGSNLQAGTTSAQLAQQRALQNQSALNQAGQFGASAANQAAMQNQAALNQSRQYGAGATNQASLSNQAALNQAGQFGSSQNMQAQLANQAAGLSGSQQRLSAGSQLGNLSNLGFGMGQTIQGRMDQQGALQQALQQNLINAGKQQYAGFTGAPAQSLQYLLQAVGGAPAVGTVEKGFEPGLFDYLSLGLGR